MSVTLNLSSGAKMANGTPRIIAVIARELTQAATKHVKMADAMFMLILHVFQENGTVHLIVINVIVKIANAHIAVSQIHVILPQEAHTALVPENG
jgi:hypothetical protein